MDFEYRAFQMLMMIDGNILDDDPHDNYIDAYPSRIAFSNSNLIIMLPNIFRYINLNCRLNPEL